VAYTSVPILVFLSLSVLDVGPMYATDRETDVVRQHHCLMTRLLGAGHNNSKNDDDDDDDRISVVSS